MHVYPASLDISAKKVLETTLFSHVIHITTAQPVPMHQQRIHVLQGLIILRLEHFVYQNVSLVQKVMFAPVE